MSKTNYLCPRDLRNFTYSLIKKKKLMLITVDICKYQKKTEENRN